jgi:predicted Zn-dependent peptidase
MRRFAAVLLLLARCISAPAPAPAPVAIAAPHIELPYRLVQLENGLTLVMQPDASMPEVGVEVWIRGGAREELPGQYGIAHLFEHNMPASGRFLGNQENRARRAAAARGSGAGTQFDFLRFYGTARPDGLEALLGYYADRLESDPEKFTEEIVKRDHDIVISELRRAQNIDWDLDVSMHLARGTFGADHPYGHSISGTEADVRAATAETMREWHRRYAGAANAIVFVVGNFDPARAEAMVRHHYGSIAPGMRMPRTAEFIPEARAKRDVLEKDVTRPAVYLRWPIPGWGTADGARLTLLAHILESTARVELLEMAGAFTLRGEAEAPMRAELERVLRDGITDAQLARAKARQQSDFVRMLQRPVWRGSRADVLGFGLMWRGNAEHYKQELADTANATTTDVREAARRWLSKPAYVLEIQPRQKRVAAPAIDRGATIAPAEVVPVQFPAVEVKDNVIKAERSALPLAQLTFAFDAGTDVEAVRERVREPLQDLGADLSVATDAGFATLSVSVLSQHAHRAMQIVSSGAAGFSPPNGEPAGLKPGAPQGPMQLRERALECLVSDCDRPKRATMSPRAIVASGDIRNLVINVNTTTHPLPPTELRAPDKEHFQIIDYPNATQVHILLAQVLPSSVAKDPLMAQLVASHALRTRLMDNLRTAKGWSYEVYPFGVELYRGAALVRFNIPVQSEKTAEAIQEIHKEIARLRDEPVTPEFLAQARSYLESTLTSGLMSLDELNERLLELARNDLPADYYTNALRRLQTITAAEVQAAARELLRPGQLIWLLAGDRATVERELRELHSPR